MKLFNYSLSRDVSSKQSSSSEVGQMFQDRSVFITGASGFIGRVLLEKLLRSYQGIKRVYILMRQKKNQQPYDRLNEQVLKVPIFDKIRSMKNGQELLDKIVLIVGDIAEPRLGISDEDMARMCADETLSIVFHSAATVRFNEPIKRSIKLNLIATREIINLCRKLSNLVALCHVSTAYVNSDIRDNSSIEEKLYPINYAPQHVIELSELMNEELMQHLSDQLVGQRPNTYTYTKALAEHLIVTEASDLPVAIVRPSIVTGAWKEPLPGWVDNLNGATGLILAFGKGLLRTLHAVPSIKTNMVPVDVVVNTMIAATFYTAKTNKKLDLIAVTTTSNADDDYTIERPLLAENQRNESAAASTMRAETLTDLECVSTSNLVTKPSANETLENSNERTGMNAINTILPEKNRTANDDEVGAKSPYIVHCTSSENNLLALDHLEPQVEESVRKYPSGQVFRYPMVTFKRNRYVDNVTKIFVHLIPALIIDMFCVLSGRKRQLMSTYGKLNSAVANLSNFLIQKYDFKTKNIKQLKASLSEFDKKQLFLDITNLNWSNYYDNYALGARRYILKESDDSLPEARKSLRRAYYIEVCLRITLFAITCAILLPFIAPPIHKTLGSFTTILTQAVN